LPEILGEAARFKASLIVLGWRGHGTFRRLLADRVSRSVAARAQCPVSGRGNRVVLVNVVQPIQTPGSIGRFPKSMRPSIDQQVTELNEEQRQQAEATVAARIERAGWAAKGEVRLGAPLASLLAAVEEHRADVLMLGARASGGLEHMLLCSVAAGALDRSPVPVMLVR
jgi:nucleotide-binding universal stress UspA family protein